LLLDVYSSNEAWPAFNFNIYLEFNDDKP